jgi:hypothetical protein
MSEEIKNNNWATPDEDAVPTTVVSGGTADPLDIDVNDIKTGYPIITAGLYDMVLEATLEDNKDKTGKNIVLKHKTTRVAKTPQGEEIEPGRVVITKWIPVTPISRPGKTPYDASSIARAIAAPAQACQPPITGTPRLIIANPTVFNGKVVRCKVVISPERVDKDTGRAYDESNDIVKYLKVS